MRALVLLGLLLTPLGAQAEATLTVLAAASLKAPLEAGVAAFEREHPGTKVVVSAAATGVLVQQVEAGAPADVLIGAAAAPLEALARKRLVGARVIVARNALVVAAPASSKAELSTLAGLAEPRFGRIAMGRPKVVPAGDYAAQALTHGGLDARLKEKLVYGESVTQVLAYLKAGEADAGFIYASDAQGAAQAVKVLLRVAPALHAPIVYPGTVVAGSKQAALGRAYLAFLTSAAGQASLQRAGLLAP